MFLTGFLFQIWGFENRASLASLLENGELAHLMDDALFRQFRLLLFCAHIVKPRLLKHPFLYFSCVLETVHLFVRSNGLTPCTFGSVSTETSLVEVRTSP
jgi:hypothetical protein